MIAGTSIGMTEMCCGKCGIYFAVPTCFYDEQKEIGINGGWYCPNGHSRVFRESNSASLRRELAQAQHKLEQSEAEARRQREFREQTERQLSATRGVVTRTKNRIGKGVCPCCSRSFTNLRRHMQGKHPEYTETKE